jgi:hypothetical protein
MNLIVQKANTKKERMCQLVTTWFWTFLYDFEKGKSAIKNSWMEKSLLDIILHLEQGKLDDVTKRNILAIRKLLDINNN